MWAARCSAACEVWPSAISHSPQYAESSQSAGTDAQAQSTGDELVHTKVLP
ncbi:hypothetical protein [Streptomyces boluensis]|uniref:Uncharacterized protein n=1 Tax=Streptomyces boluensis TaxID=1775135 RepID=A0A964XK44_9ACTN|nr:hypothetical protein [Streptomyces boluensis]NBE51984.1 hypothetical protein [Streptomyces boluensis]